MSSDSTINPDIDTVGTLVMDHHRRIQTLERQLSEVLAIVEKLAERQNADTNSSLRTINAILGSSL
jgi:hypothetical protein